MGLTQEEAGKKHGWRSGLEKSVAKILEDNYKGDWWYEQLVINFVQPAKPRKYTPDFILGSGLILETKGRWIRADRLKMKMIVEQYPELSELGILRMVFSNAKSRISKTSKTTYAAYSERIGLMWAHRVVPKAWLEEEFRQDRMDVIERLLKGGN